MVITVAVTVVFDVAVFGEFKCARRPNRILDAVTRRDIRGN